MTWLFFLGAVLALVLFAVLTGFKPSGARKVRDTRLMGIARVILVVVALALILLALQ